MAPDLIAIEEALLPSRVDDDRLVSMIVRSAALSTGCGTAIFLKPEPNDPKVLARVGQEVDLRHLSTALSAVCDGVFDKILVIDDGAENAEGAVALMGAGDFRFLCSVPVLDKSDRCGACS